MAHAAGSDAAARPGSGNLRVLRHLWAYVRPYRARVIAASAALLLAAGTVLALGRGVRTLVDEGFARGNAALLDQAMLILLGVVALLAAASFARHYLVTWLGERVVADVRRDVFSHVLALHPGFFETTRTGEVLSRLTTDTTLLQTVVGTSVPIAVRNLLLLAGGTVLLIVTSPALTGLVFLVTPLVLIPVVVFGRRVRRLSRASQDRVADVGVHVDECLANIRTVQAFNHEAVDRRRFRERAEDAFATAIARTRARAALSAIVILLTFSAVGAVLWAGGHAVLAGRMTPGELSAFVFYAVVVAGAVGALSDVAGNLQRAAGATERLLDLLATEPAIAAPSAPAPLPEPPRGEVRFDGVTFRYPARPDPPALHELSLHIAPGEKVALVGPSGAGKSTLFHLLLRFYDPDTGGIRLDGVDLRAADPAAVRARLSVVPQEPVIFSADAMENIRFGRPEASDAAVRRAAEAAGVAELLDALPHGFATHLGERGVRLSGGQRQRIAIARAILRDPAVLLLDEATSALDAESERAVQAALDRLSEGRTTLMIAHRLASVQRADRIVVLDHGRIVETGTHAELLARGGLYAHLAGLQFQTGPTAAVLGAEEG